MSAKGQAQRRTSSVEMLLLRDRLGYKRYRKTAKRDPEKRRLLLEMALDKIAKAERDNYIVIGPRRRKVIFRPH
jgi:hypothetical protein